MARSHVFALSALAVACATPTDVSSDAGADATVVDAKLDQSTDVKLDTQPSDAFSPDSSVDAQVDVVDAGPDVKIDSGPCTPSYGPSDPTAASDDSAIGTRIWSQPMNVVSSNNQNAEVSAMINNEISHYLRASGFGFSIPLNATIAGFEVTIERSALSGVGVADDSVQLVKGGTVVTAKNLAKVGVWATTEMTITYGGPTELWGTTWTALDVAAGNFGVALSTKYTSVSGNDWPRVDNIRVKVYVTCN